MKAMVVFTSVEDFNECVIPLKIHIPVVEDSTGGVGGASTECNFQMEKAHWTT